jgi:hypothetical protein
MLKPLVSITIAWLSLLVWIVEGEELPAPVVFAPSPEW